MAEFEFCYKTIATRLHLHEAQTNLLGAVGQFLERDGSGNWLMILDSLEEDKKELADNDHGGGAPSPKKSPLDYCPRGHLYGGQVLITTRSKALAILAVSNQITQTLHVSPLEDDDVAHLLLEKRTGTAADEKNEKCALEVADALGRSAAGLEWAFATYRATDSDASWKDYLSRLRCGQGGRSADPSEEATSVADLTPMLMTAWNLAYKTLWQKHEHTAQLLQQMCIFDMQAIPSFLFQNWPDPIYKQMNILCDYSMIQQSDRQWFTSVCPMTRHCMLAWLKSKKEWVTVAELVLERVTKAYPSTPTEEATCAKLDLCARAALKFETGTATAKSHRAELLCKMGGYYLHLKRYQTCVEYLDQCLALQEQGASLGESNAVEARRMLQQARADMSGTSPASREVVAGIQSTKPGQDAKLEKIKSMADLVNAEDAEFASNLAASLYRAEDDVRTADSLTCTDINEKVVKWSTDKLGPTHIDTGRQKYNLALAYDFARRHDEAEKAYIHGEASSEALMMLGSLARMYVTQGRLKKAEETFKCILERQIACLGRDHPDTLVTRHNSALLQQELGRIEPARDELRSILGVQVKLLGDEDPAALRTACSLALNCRLRKQVVEAEELYLQVAGQQERVIGEKHPDTVTTRKMLAELRAEMGKGT
ncbi:hypothetical protein BX600DRAFT_529193 [Xylariales sp. PMI_506]|nr:hypothetical protein BX600DRAFT_529193 [Xylariales sp. PMI_506]